MMAFDRNAMKIGENTVSKSNLQTIRKQPYIFSYADMVSKQYQAQGQHYENIAKVREMPKLRTCFTCFIA